LPAALPRRAAGLRHPRPRTLRAEGHVRLARALGAAGGADRLARGTDGHAVCVVLCQPANNPPGDTRKQFASLVLPMLQFGGLMLPRSPLSSPLSLTQQTSRPRQLTGVLASTLTARPGGRKLFKMRLRSRLAGILVLSMVLAGRVLATTFTVDGTGDTSDTDIS